MPLSRFYIFDILACLLEGLCHSSQQVDVAKHSLGERGAVWWCDGAPDLNRRLVKNTPYAHWFAERSDAGQ